MPPGVVQKRLLKVYTIQNIIGKTFLDVVMHFDPTTSDYFLHQSSSSESQIDLQNNNHE